MDSFSQAMSAAASGMDAQGFRMRIVSENIANVETPGYHRKLTTFGNVFDRDTGVSRVAVGRVSLDGSPVEERYDPSHPLADESGYVDMSNVNMVLELADAREAGRSYEANLATFKQAREMYSSLLDLLKR